MSDEHGAHDSPAQQADEPVLLEQKSHKVAHQLNNVLGIIRGNIEMLSCEAQFSEKSEQRLAKINDAIEKAADLVSKIYEFEFHIESQNKSENQAENQSSEERKRTVLIVDDEVDLVEIVSRQLQFRGFSTLTATSAEQALQILADNKSIDLLFTDIVMNSGMNGLQLAKLVHEQYPTIRILLTTGHTQHAEKSQLSSDYIIDALLMAKLPKPYTYQELVNAIEELL